MKNISTVARRLKQPYHWIKGVAANLLYFFPSRKIKIIAITGTDGKTTTASLVYSILRNAGKKVALISTVAAYIGEQEIDTGFHVTNPAQFQLQKLIRKIVKQGYEYLVLEVTSHGIYQHRILGIRPLVSALTNITHEHLDYHGSFKEYAEVKLSLLKKSKIAVINRESSMYKQIKHKLSRLGNTIIPYSSKTLDRVIKSAIDQRFSESYNKENAAAAVAVCQVLHISLKDCAKGILNFSGVVGRMQQIPNNKGIKVVVDFAHTPNALEVACRALRASMKSTQQLICVFGCAGLRDPYKRPAMGKIASTICNEVVLTAEDPRTEDVNTIIRQIKDGIISNYGHVHEISDRRKAIQFAIQNLANKTDVVAIFGKGHEKSLNLDGKKELPWSDQQEALLALEGKNNGR